MEQQQQNYNAFQLQQMAMLQQQQQQQFQHFYPQTMEDVAYIAKQFTSDYYQMMTSHPAHLFHFYGQQSSFTLGVDGHIG